MEKNNAPELRRWKLNWKIFMSSTAFGNGINDIYFSSWSIFFSFISAYVICFSFLKLMSMFAEKIAWFAVVFAQIGLFVVSIFFFLGFIAIK